mmetsp:Transcript_18169/g.15837  ORF Transcript_18169/g.15837 Transcript_18169/m.15837 type:complete len:158 (-) Transcript_18169:895-1368(-)
MMLNEESKTNNSSGNKPSIFGNSNSGNHSGNHSGTNLLDLLNNSINKSHNTSLRSPGQELQNQMNNMTLQNSNQIDLTPLDHSGLNRSSRTDNTEGDWSLEEDLYGNEKYLKSIYGDKAAPGTHTRDDRLGRILKYKNKIKKWRNAHPVNRNFKGRS